MRALMGAGRVLARARPVILTEMFEPFLKRFGDGCAQLHAHMVSLDYEGFLLDSAPTTPHKFRLEPLSLNMLSDVETNNVLYIPKENSAQVMQRLLG